ncbi:MAG: segregation/condensation protein A, partial [Armatimonadetes bacterium]|nr:segregation/condensation protein A [Armatimonadota bacterium]
ENIVAAAREQAEEYLTYRAIAECLRQAREERERIFIRSADVEEIESGWVTIEDASVFDMVAALARVLERMERRPTAVLMRPRWSIRGQILYIRQRLKETDGRQLSFEDLFDQASDRLWVVVTFLALLELIRRGEVGVAVVEDGSVAVYARE